MKMLAGFAIAATAVLLAQPATNTVAKPPSADSYLAASYEAWQQGRYSESIASAREALKLHPGLALAWNNMAASYNALGLFDDGMRSAQEAVRLQPDFALAKNNLEWAKSNLDSTPEGYITRSPICFRQGNYEESLKAAQAAQHLRPHYAEAWNNIAAADNALSRWADGIQAAEQAIRLKPDFELAKNNLKWAQSQLKTNAATHP
jgi:tetratricopeptide (TPR) repeat protein